jgi:hypothetical protein
MDFYYFCFSKVKQSLYTPWRRLGGEEYSSYSFTTSALDGGQHHAPAALYPRGKDPRYPLYRRLGGPQSRSGHMPPPGIEPRSPGRPARSKTLYCLSYPGSHFCFSTSIFIEVLLLEYFFFTISIEFFWNCMPLFIRSG